MSVPVFPAAALKPTEPDHVLARCRSRTDTIRCIVASLIEEGNPLFVELSSSDAKLVSDSRDEAENYNDPKWTPDPVDAPPSELSLSMPRFHSTDLLSS